MEFLFVSSLMLSVSIFIYIKFHKHQYILKFNDNDASLQISIFLSLFTFCDTLTLALIPLHTRCAAMGFLMSEFKYVNGSIRNQVQGYKLKRKVNLSFVIKAIVVICCIAFDVYEILEQ
jgi:hypothetical protein